MNRGSAKERRVYDEAPIHKGTAGVGEHTAGE